MATIDVTNPARDVLNQAPPLHPINLFDTDLALVEALEREGGGWGVDRVREAGAVAGSVETLEHGRRAERNLPILRTHDRYGNRIDQVELDPSWHWLLRGAIERSIHGAAVARAAAGGARRPGGAVRRLGQRQRRRDVPGVDDLRRDPGAARRRAGAGRRMGAAADQARLRARRAGRDGDDRAPGRLRRARQHHARGAGRRRRV